MEIENKTTALIDEPTVILEKIIPRQHFKFNFETQSAPATHPERNDYYWPKIYDIRKHDFEITVKPIDTSFWRFGFRYSQTQDFPPMAEARHENKNIVDIHICVGDMPKSRKWHNGNKVFIQSYNVPHKLNPQIIEANYKGEEITFITKWNPRTSHVDYQLVSNGRILYQNAFKLDSFNSCLFGGWADFNTYKLAADIKIIHNNRRPEVFI